MRVIEIREKGGPEVLRLAERPSPGLPSANIRVRVAASGVNRADLSQRRGRYPVPPGYPEEIPGLEFAGTVVEVGEGCRMRSVGDQVMGILGGGGYADEATLSEEETIRIPDGISPLEAGAIPEAFITAWDALRQANLAPGETVLIHSVGSGVGTAALQLALAIGCRTIGTSRSEWKLQRALELGLHQSVLLESGGTGSEWVSQIEEGTVDVILDLVGGGLFEGNLNLLAVRGRWVVVGLTSGSLASLNLRTFITKRVTLIGTVLRSRSLEEKVVLARTFEEVVVPLFEAGRLRPVIDRIFPANEVADAHRHLEGNANFGKVLLSWDPVLKDEDER